MSKSDSDDKKMALAEVSRVVKEMLAQDPGCLIISGHCLKRMKERGINHRDIVNVLLGGRCVAVEIHIKSGLWVYKFETNSYRVECNAHKYDSIVAITAIRKGRD